MEQYTMLGLWIGDLARYKSRLMVVTPAKGLLSPLPAQGQPHVFSEMDDKGLVHETRSGTAFVVNNGVVATARHNLELPDENNQPTLAPWVWLWVYNRKLDNWSTGYAVSVDPQLTDKVNDIAVINERSL